MDRVLIIDGLNFIYRSKVRQLQHQGRHSIVFNFIRNLRNLIEQFTPDKVFFITEGEGSNFRYSIYSNYKANRRFIKHASYEEKKPKEDVEFNTQRDIIIDLLQYLPITLVSATGVEGDDIAASLVDNLRAENITLVSNDSDWVNIIQRGYKNVRLYNPFKQQFVQAPTYLVSLFKALFGDRGDNIPSLTNEKTAKLIASDPSKLEEFLDNEENRANFEVNRQLVELRLLPDTDLILTDGKTNYEVLKLHFRNMNMDSIVRTEYFNKLKETFDKVKL